MMFKTFVSLFLTSFLSLGFLNSCSSTPKTYELPAQNQFPGYKIIDGVDRDSLDIKIDRDKKIAVVVRDIGTTSYSYLEPRYNNSIVTYEGLSRCCRPTSMLMGNSGLAVYKFSFIGLGKTKIELVSRQKGLSTVASHFDTDNVVRIDLNIKD